MTDATPRSSAEADIALTSRLLGVALPAALSALLARGGTLRGRRLLSGAPGATTGHVLGAATLLRSARPDLPRDLVPFCLDEATALCAVAGSDDPAVVEVALGSDTAPAQVAERLSDYASDDAATRLREMVAGAASDAEALDALAQTLGMEVAPSLRDALLAPPPAQLESIAYRLRGPSGAPPGLLWAIDALASGRDPAPPDLLPIAPVDERSFACAVVRRDGPLGPEALGRVVRWHLGAVPPRAQRAILDTDAPSYLAAAAEELGARKAGLAKMAKIAEKYARDHAKGDRIGKAREEHPIRLAVQNVIVGLAALYHDSDFDGLNVTAWQTCQAPHINAHEGARGLTAAMLAEAFRAGGTMEVRFSDHPEKVVPASLRQFARTRGVALGATDAAAITPAEARALFLAVVGMPAGLRARIDGLARSGLLSPERACFILQSGVWRAIELDFILAVSARFASILRGGADPFDRPARQAELDVCRSASMAGMLAARLSESASAASGARVFEDDRATVAWRVLDADGALVLSGMPAGPMPWSSGEPPLGSGESLVVVPRWRASEADFETARRLGAEAGARAAVLAAALAGGAGRQAEVALLACPDKVADLDKAIDGRLLSCRVGRA